MKITLEQYQAAHEAAVFVNRHSLGILKFTGKSRLDLLHRMSTQSVNRLQSGSGAATVLTSEIGRIIDRLILYASSESVYALTSENNSDAIARYLMRFVFFNDDFHIEDLSGETAVFGVYGPLAQAKLIGLGFPDDALPLHHWRQVELEGVTAYLHRTDPIAGEGYFVMCKLADEALVCDKLHRGGIMSIGEEAFNALRIEAGMPRFGAEVSPDYIPLETGLWDDVSFSKGCYIGQEIIARMESRGKLAKKLVRLKAESAVDPPAELMSNGKKAGILTSLAKLPHGYVGLGYVKTAVLAAGSPLMSGSTALQVQE